EVNWASPKGIKMLLYTSRPNHSFPPPATPIRNQQGTRREFDRNAPGIHPELDENSTGIARHGTIWSFSRRNSHARPLTATTGRFFLRQVRPDVRPFVAFRL